MLAELQRLPCDSAVVRSGPEVMFHEGSTKVSPGFHEVLRGLRGGASTKQSTACCWGYHLSLLFFRVLCEPFQQLLRSDIGKAPRLYTPRVTRLYTLELGGIRLLAESMCAHVI